MSNEWNEDDDQKFTVTTLPELPDKKQESRDRAGDSLLALEDKLAGLEAYISHTKQPSKRIMRALLKRARFHARVARSIHFLGGGQ